MSTPSVRVRIAVVVDNRGRWGAVGYTGHDPEDAAASASDCRAGTDDDPSTTWEALRWVEADIPLPGQPTVEGLVAPREEKP